ncbi:hypothetical protein F5884DRAFT_682288, partial [Xylogone sp. PMI_703]
LGGFLGALISPQWFIAEQIAFSPLESITPNAQLVAYQLGNVYLLLGLVGTGVLYATTEAKVVRNYLIALWLGDIGHIALTYIVLQHDRFMDIGNWNAMTWGNVGVTFGLFLTRTLYLLGFFGPNVQILTHRKVQ